MEDSVEEAAKKKKGNFQATWLKEFPWANYDASEDKIFCRLCGEARKLCLFPQSLYVRENFISLGFSNWKHGKQTLKSHDESDQHKIAVLKLDNISQKSVLVQLSDKALKEQEECRVALRAVVTSLRFLGQQG